MAQQDTNRPFAVVTGASRTNGVDSIGFQLAKQFALNGFDLLITSETPDIQQAAQELGGYTKVQAVQVDLAEYEGVHTLMAAIRESDRPIDAIAINAGVGVGGPFLETSLEDEVNMINLNVVSTYHLAKHVAQDMAARGKGRMLLTASIAGTMPTPFETVYGATKAFVLSLAGGLRDELKDKGVVVTALMPGPTETNFFHRAELDDTQVGQSKKDDPAKVAEDGFKALMKGDAHIVAGSFKSKLMGFMNEIMPEQAKAGIHHKMSEPGSGKKAA